MKKFVHILIAGLILFTTTGFTITKHYCGGNLVDIAINSIPESCCGDNGGGCCSNEQSVFQFKSIFELPLNQCSHKIQSTLFETAFVEVELPEVDLQQITVLLQANSPPLFLKEIRYISQQSDLSPPLF